MPGGNEVVIAVKSDAKGVKKGFDDAGKGFDKLKKDATGAEGAMGGAQRGMGQMGTAAFHASSQTEPFRQDVKEMDSRMGSLAAGTGDVSGAMGGMNFLLAKIGIVGISAGLALRVVTRESDKLRTSAAATNVTARLLGPAAVQSLEEARPAFQGLAEQFGFVESDALTAAGAIMIASEREVVDIGKVEAALGLMRTEGLSAEEAGKLVGEAWRGDIDVLDDVIGRTRDLDQSLKIVVEEALNATTEFQRTKAQALGIATHLGTAADKALGMVKVFLSPSYDRVSKDLEDLDALIDTLSNKPIITITFGLIEKTPVPDWVKAVAKWYLARRPWDIFIGMHIVDKTLSSTLKKTVRKFLDVSDQIWTATIELNWKLLKELPGWITSGFKVPITFEWKKVFDLPGWLLKLIRSFAGDVRDATGGSAQGFQQDAIAGLSTPNLAFAGAGRGPITLTVNVENFHAQDELSARRDMRALADLLDENLRRGPL